MSLTTTLSREQVAVIITLKWVQDRVKSYNGKPKDFKAWLLTELQRLNDQSDQILASAFQP